MLTTTRLIAFAGLVALVIAAPQVPPPEDGTTLSPWIFTLFKANMPHLRSGLGCGRLGWPKRDVTPPIERGESSNFRYHICILGLRPLRLRQARCP